MIRKFGVISWLIFIVLSSSLAQNSELSNPPRAEIKGTPRIIHYSRNDFKGDPQIWTMCQDSDGIMYFGNNDGTLIFDGAKWHKIILPNNSSVRSLIYSDDGKVYAGGFNEFGIIERDAFGNYSYKSLLEQLRPEERNLENIWDIHEVQDHIIFRSFSKLVALSNNKAFTIPAEDYYYSTVVNDELYLVDSEGIKKLDLESFEFETLVLPAQINNNSVSEIIEGNKPGELTIITRQGDSFIYHVNSRNITFFKNYLEKNSNNEILSALKSTAGNTYLGTLSSEIIVLNEMGEIIPIEDDFMDLQDNTVLNLFESGEGNIWALLNNGIDCINISSPISVLFENASVFDVLIRGGKIYAATNQGVYVSQRFVQNPHFASLKFKKIPGLEGQSWRLQVLNGFLVCSHDRGAFIIDGEEILQLEGVKGVWKILPIEGKPDYYFVCTYTGIHMMHYKEGEGLHVLYRFNGFNESSRDIIQSNEDGVFWVCHGYKGIFKIQFDKNYQKVLGVESFQEKGLPSPFNINVFRWNDQIVFTTNKGIYSYDKVNNQFLPMTELNSIFGSNVNVRKLLQYEEKTWFVQDDEAGYFTQEDHTLQKGLFLELKGSFNRGMECISPINVNNVLIGTTTGLYAYDLSFQSLLGSSKTLFSEISYRLNDTRIQHALNESTNSFSHQVNDIRFEFSAPKLKDQTQVQYSYKLEGVDENWSDWSEEPYKEFTRLYPGKYTFRVKSRSMIGENAKEAVVNFNILPVWYLTSWAFSGYIILILIGAFASRKLLKKRIVEEKEKTRAEEKKKQTVLELELQQMRLEREKERIEKDKKSLEEDVIFKSKELANYTMLLVRKRELLTDLREDLKDLKEVAKNEKSRNLLRNLVRKIGIHLNDEEHIHVFEANFERVHHEFFAELKTHFPDLTSKELRLCALVKMNLTNKEIAPILNISLRGVETARYRLRKRLSLDHEENMVEFLEKLAP
ncbi:MAG: triple tyrosine motif-containing protein [Marinoscillum sp.]